MKYSILLPVLIVFVLSSCVTTKKTTYLQEYKKSDYSGEYSTPDDYLIQPNDNLYIRVSTPDPSLSDIFNSTPGGGVMSMDENTANLMSYTVQLDGEINLPYIGSLNVAGKTLSEATALLENELVDYITNASISIKLVNNYVSILGEVRAPGMYPIYKERLNIYQALAMAGDMAEYSDRRELKIVRQTEEGSIVKEFNLTDKNIIGSEFYYVMPNDIIYARPMKGKFFRMNQFPITLLLSTLTTGASLFILVQNYILLATPQ